MTAKQYLQQLINLDMYIKAKEEDYELVLARATQSTKRLKDVRVQTSRDLSKQEDLAAKCAQISMDIDRATKTLLELQEEARAKIELLDDNRYKAVLTLRYLSGRSWMYIAEKLHYSIRQVHNLHGEALLAFENHCTLLHTKA